MRRAGIGLTIALFAVAPALAGDAEAERRSQQWRDQSLARTAANAILAYEHYGVFDSVGLRVARGEITLLGSVYRPLAREEIERRVSGLRGVTGVYNEIRVQPASLFDDRLRSDLYRRIYGHSLLARHAGSPDPPVRIVVENGHVTLSGLVASRVEQSLVGHLARGSQAFSVDNRVEIEGEQSVDQARLRVSA
jgi:hyperosmotically inducible protein